MTSVPNETLIPMICATSTPIGSRPHRAGTLKTDVNACICTTLAASRGSPVNQEASVPSSAREVLTYWFGAFVVANVASVIVVAALGSKYDSGDNLPTWLIALSATAMWSVYVTLTGRYLRVPVGKIYSTLHAKIHMRDVMVGVPLGIASQLILVNAVTWPLSKLFPDVFSFDEVSKRASDLADNANGVWIVALILVVVVGAPIVEEMVYRGVVQPGLVAAWGPRGGIWFTAILFAAIHFQPIEFPGLLAFALVLGWARQSTDRLGLSVVTHTAFNATGLLLVFLV